MMALYPVPFLGVCHPSPAFLSTFRLFVSPPRPALLLRHAHSLCSARPRTTACSAPPPLRRSQLRSTHSPTPCAVRSLPLARLSCLPLLGLARLGSAGEGRGDRGEQGRRLEAQQARQANCTLLEFSNHSLCSVLRRSAVLLEDISVRSSLLLLVSAALAHCSAIAQPIQVTCRSKSGLDGWPGSRNASRCSILCLTAVPLLVDDHGACFCLPSTKSGTGLPTVNSQIDLRIYWLKLQTKST